MSNGNVSQALGYARAIHELALDPWQQSVLAVKNQLSGNLELLAALDDTGTAFEERRAQLDKILPADITEQVKNFFYLMLKEGTFHLLEDVQTNLSKMVAVGGTLELATVTTVYPLSAAEQEQFKAKLTAQYGQNVQVRFKVDKDIMGGVIVQVGDKILDGSLSTKLNAVRDSLTIG